MGELMLAAPVAGLAEKGRITARRRAAAARRSVPRRRRDARRSGIADRAAFVLRRSVRRLARLLRRGGDRLHRPPGEAARLHFGGQRSLAGPRDLARRHGRYAGRNGVAGHHPREGEIVAAEPCGLRAGAGHDRHCRRQGIARAGAPDRTGVVDAPRSICCAASSMPAAATATSPSPGPRPKRCSASTTPPARR